MNFRIFLNNGGFVEFSETSEFRSSYQGILEVVSCEIGKLAIILLSTWRRDQIKRC